MSKFKKLVSIYKGWKNYTFENIEIERIAKKRASICANCPESIKGYSEIIKDGRIENISGMKCNLCECPLPTKLRSIDENCPKELW